MKKRLIVIPVYNEALNLTDLIAALREYYSGDILVINDGSTDGTEKILTPLCTSQLIAINHKKNRGYGASLIEGFQYAVEQGYDEVVTMDADWQHEPAFVMPLFQKLSCSGADVISGSRYHSLSTVSGVVAPEDRRAINTEITHHINKRFGLHLTDTFCGFKAYCVQSLERLQLTEQGYAFPLQFWVQCVVFGLKIIEVPVPRVYLDAKKTFPGELKDATVRRKRYLEVLESETNKWQDRQNGWKSAQLKNLKEPCKLSTGPCIC